uniref:Secretory carrier-associated membrane protein n=1 Tax=Caenorhabditis tropicalis TaxID=1561998 RepID=A0A1I7UE72_9PELO
MSDNPFADPFAAPPPKTTPAAAPAGSSGVTEDFNPFANRAGSSSTNNAQPSTHQSSTGFGSTKSAGMDDELFRKQQDLERRAQELRMREEELDRRQRNTAGNLNTGAANNAPRPHNWPPLPTIIPIEPCFYQDIEVEIPVQFQKTVTLAYYVFLVYVLALVVNVVASLFFMIFAGGSIGQLFLACIQLALFSPCSFLFWFRPVYKAFRNDSSFNFMVFFFVLFFHCIFTFVQTLGLSNYACGWINALDTFKVSVPVALIMLISAITFTVALTGMVTALVKVHRLYRGAGFSIDKARQEFTNGVMSDSGVQRATQAATQVAAGAAFNQATQGRF